jgi:uncharacterized protein
MSVTATSRVATERGERYRKQLASHFGNKIEVAEDAETLHRVKDVTGRHLERFGEKDGLVVTWQ